MNIKRLLCCLALMACASIALAENTAPAKPAEKAVPAGKRDAASFTEHDIKAITSGGVLQRMVLGYEKLGDHQRLAWTLSRLTTLYPNSGDLRMALAVTYAKLGDKSKAYDLLLKMKGQGFGYDLSKDSRFEKISDTKVWDYVVSNLQSNLQPFGEGKVAFDLPKGDTLFESLAWDPKRQKLLVGSVREGKIYLADKNGKLEEFITAAQGNGLWSIYAMAADPERDLLYVASTSALYFKGFSQQDFGKAGVFKFKLSTGKLVAKYLLPTGQGVHTLSSITVGKNGQVFAADGVRNEVYKIEGDALKLVVANPNLVSLRGLAVSDDGNTLYMADYTLGIFGADLKAGTGFALMHDPEQLVLGGIEGLYWYDGTLVAIENGMSPKRVIRLSLSADGKSVTKMMPLDVANAAFAMPTYGTVAGTDLYYIANSQKALYDQYGELKQGAIPKAVQVFKSNLRFAWGKGGISAGGMQPARQASPDEAKKMLMTPPSMLLEQQAEEAKQTPVPVKKD